MRTYFRLVGISAFLIAGAAILAQPRGPLDPPAGPVQPTGPSLNDIMGAIKALEGGGAQPVSPVPGDTLFAGIPLDTADQTIYFQVSNIQGDVSTPPYNGWSSALSVAQMVTRPAGGQTMFATFRILAQLDRAFTPLMQRSVSGTPGIAEATVDHLQTFPSGPVRYLRVRLINPSLVATTPIFQSRACVYEFDFVRIEWTFTPLGADGRPTGPDLVFCWNRQTGTQCN